MPGGEECRWIFVQGPAALDKDSLEPFDEVEVTVGKTLVEKLDSGEWDRITKSCGLKPQRQGDNYTLQGHYLQIAALRFSLEEKLRRPSHSRSLGSSRRQSRGEGDAAEDNTRAGAATPSLVHLTQTTESVKQYSSKDRTYGSVAASIPERSDVESDDAQQPSGAYHGNAARDTHVSTVTAGRLRNAYNSDATGSDEEEVERAGDTRQKQDKRTPTKSGTGLYPSLGNGIGSGQDFSAAEDSNAPTGTLQRHNLASGNGGPRHDGSTKTQRPGPSAAPRTGGGARAFPNVENKREEDDDVDYDEEEERNGLHLVNSGPRKLDANGRGNRDSSGNMFEVNLAQNLKLMVYQKSILEVPVEAIACSVDAHLTHGGVVSDSLMHLGGSEYSEQVQKAKKGLEHTYLPDYNCKTVFTDPIRQIPFQYVILVSVPAITGLDLCTRNILEEAKVCQVKSLGLPLLGTGRGGESATKAADVMMKALTKTVGQLGQHLREIHFVHPDHRTVGAMEDALKNVAVANTSTEHAETPQKSKSCQIL